jgi:hypothetical protein
MILEEFSNKKILKMCMTKWYGENPTNEQTFEADNLLTKFFQLKNQNLLSPNNTQFRTFFYNFPNFDKTKTIEPTFYSLEQIKFIIDEFFEPNGEDDDTPEALRRSETGKPKNYSENTVEASKSLWFGDRYCIINQEGFRVYKIPTRDVSQNFGYYERYVGENPPFNKPSPWCVTWLERNYYDHYRQPGSRGRSFYFVIDESKSPEFVTDINVCQYYLSALQTAEDSPTGFRITSILNNGDKDVTEKQIVNIWPELSGKMDLIIPVKYNAQLELGQNADLIDFINERVGDTYEFAKVSTKLKEKYINRGKALSKATSWNILDLILKKSYIDTTTKDTIHDKFSLEIYNAIKSDSDKSIFGYFSKKLKDFGYSLTELVSRFMKDTYNLIRMSKNSDDISLYITKSKPSKYGIWNAKNNDWQEVGGITYDDIYSDPTSEVFKSSKDDKRYFGQIFNTSGQPDNRSFVVLYSSSQEDKAMGYFMTYNKFLELKENERLYKEGQEDIDTDIENYSDIKEWK